MNVSILFVVQGIYIKILSLFKKSGRPYSDSRIASLFQLLA